MSRDLYLNFQRDTIHEYNANPDAYLPKSEETHKKLGRGGIIAIIIVVIIIIIIIIVVIVLLSKKKNTSTAVTGPAGVTCTKDSDCASPEVCDTTHNLCVECLDNSTCTNKRTPFCLVGNKTCVECLDQTGCANTADCCNNQCCDTSPPVITGIVTNLSSNSSIIISYTYKQPARLASVIAILSDPATGTPLIARTTPEVPATKCSATKPCCTCPNTLAGGCSTTSTPPSANSCSTVATPPCTIASNDKCVSGACIIQGGLTFAATGSFGLIERQIAITIYPLTNYNISIKMAYQCGVLTGASTAYTTMVFQTGNCNAHSTAPVIRNIFIGMKNVSGAPYSTIDGIVVQYNYSDAGLLANPPTTADPVVQVGFVASPTSNIHPNLAEVQGGVTVTRPDTFEHGGFQIAILPYPPSGTYYIRSYVSGAANQITNTPATCNSALSNQGVFTFCAANLVPPAIFNIYVGKNGGSNLYTTVNGIVVQFAYPNSDPAVQVGVITSTAPITQANFASQQVNVVTTQPDTYENTGPNGNQIAILPYPSSTGNYYVLAYVYSPAGGNCNNALSNNFFYTYPGHV